MIGTLAPHEIESMLASHHTGRLAVAVDDRPWVVPMTYVYDGESLYSASQPGRKIDTMRAQPNTCFEIDEVNGPGLSAAWRSVVVEGVFEELDTEAERADARALLRVVGCDEDEVDATQGLVYFRIHPVLKSGRFGQAPR